MRKIFASTLLAMAIMLGGCGGDTHESLAQEGVSAFNEFASILEGVSDVESAKAAVPKLEAVGQKMADLKKRADALGKPTPEQNKALEEKFTKEMSTAMDKMMAASMKLADKPEVQKILEEPMKKLRGGMQ